MTLYVVKPSPEDEALFIRYAARMGRSRFMKKFYPDKSYNWYNSRAAYLDIRKGDEYERGLIPLEEAADYLGVTRSRLKFRVDREHERVKATGKYQGRDMPLVIAGSKGQPNCRLLVRERFIEQLKSEFDETRAIAESPEWITEEKVGEMFGISDWSVKRVFQKPRRKVKIKRKDGRALYVSRIKVHLDTVTRKQKRRWFYLPSVEEQLDAYKEEMRELAARRR